MIEISIPFVCMKLRVDSTLSLAQALTVADAGCDLVAGTRLPPSSAVDPRSDSHEATSG